MNLTLEVRPDKNYANAKHLSRLNEKFVFEAIDEYFFDTQLFYVDVISYEYVNIIEYMQNNKFLRILMTNKSDD